MVSTPQQHGAQLLDSPQAALGSAPGACFWPSPDWDRDGRLLSLLGGAFLYCVRVVWALWSPCQQHLAATGGQVGGALLVQ